MTLQEKAIVLIVDDMPSNIQTLASILKDDYTIKVATDGNKAIEIAQKYPQPDLILLDVVMPDMDGYEVCQELNTMESTKEIPVIFITGNNEIEDEEKGFEIGGVDYITKPVNSAIVKARIKTHITIKYQHDQLKYIALHDKLTGLYNRHFLMDEAKRKIAVAKRKYEPLTIVISDIDHFKNVNDNYGHLVGDEILKAVAQTLLQNKRLEDFVARYGGEEFVSIYDNCDEKNAVLKIENIRKNIENLNPNGIKITSSFGVVQMNHTHKNLDMLLKDADTSLYHAKETGRNKVVSFSSLQNKLD